MINSTLLHTCLFRLSLFFLILFANLFALGQQNTTTLIYDGDRLYLTEAQDTIFFGAITKGDAASRTITLINQSEKPFQISNVRGSCGVSIPLWPRNIIEPGTQANIQLRYDSSRPGPFSRIITIHSNSLNSRYVLYLSGVVVPMN